jgi:hypothetical protein
MDLKQVMAGTSPAQEQNLITENRIITAGRPDGFYKSIVLDILSVAVAALFGYLYYRYLTVGISVWFVVGGLALFGVLTVLQVFLSNSPNRRVAILLCEIAALMIIFRNDNWRILVITGVTLLLFQIWGYFAGRSRLRNSVEIPFFSMTGNTLGKFTTGILIFMILTYVPQLNSNSTFISQQSFRAFFNWSAGFLSGFYPNLALTDSFGNFAQSVAKMELANNPSFENLNTEEQNLEISQAATQFSDTFSKPSPTPITASDTTSDAFYNVIEGMMAAWQSQSSGWFVIGWGVVLFIALRSVGIVFVWLDQFICLIFYEILLASGFMKVMEQSQSKEIIVY